MSIEIYSSGILGGWRHRNLGGNQSRVGADGRLNGIGHIRVELEKLLGLVPALPDTLAIVGVPGTGLFNDTCGKHLDEPTRQPWKFLPQT